jgi:hypothetical protein
MRNDACSQSIWKCKPAERKIKSDVDQLVAKWIVDSSICYEGRWKGQPDMKIIFVGASRSRSRANARSEGRNFLNTIVLQQFGSAESTLYCVQYGKN